MSLVVSIKPQNFKVNIPRFINQFAETPKGTKMARGNELSGVFVFDNQLSSEIPFF